MTEHCNSLKICLGFGFSILLAIPIFAAPEKLRSRDLVPNFTIGGRAEVREIEQKILELRRKSKFERDSAFQLDVLISGKAKGVYFVLGVFVDASQNPFQVETEHSRERHVELLIGEKQWEATLEEDALKKYRAAASRLLLRTSYRSYVSNLMGEDTIIIESRFFKGYTRNCEEQSTLGQFLVSSFQLMDFLRSDGKNAGALIRIEKISEGLLSELQVGTEHGTVLIEVQDPFDSSWTSAELPFIDLEKYFPAADIDVSHHGVHDSTQKAE